MADKAQIAAQKYMTAKPIKFNNPLSSWQEFQTQVGMPVSAAWNGILKVGNWIENSRFGKWANQSTPNPVLKTLSSAGEKVSIQNTGDKPLTAEEIAKMLEESRTGVQNLPAIEPSASSLSAQSTPTAQAKPVTSVNTGLFTGDLRSYQARKNWVQENMEYLMSVMPDMDWNAYRGTMEQNLALKSLIGGLGNWQEKQKREKEERLLAAPVTRLVPLKNYVGFTDATIRGGQEPDRGAMLRTPSIAANTKFGKIYIPSTYTEEETGKVYSFKPLQSQLTEEAPEMSPEQKFVTDIYNSGKSFTDDELKNIAGGTDWINYARHFNGTDLDRFMSIKTGLKSPNDLSYTRRPAEVQLPLTFKRFGELLKPSMKTGGKVNYQKIFK